MTVSRRWPGRVTEEGFGAVSIDLLPGKTAVADGSSCTWPGVTWSKQTSLDERLWASYRA